MDGELLSATFVELTDTMVADFDVIDFLHVLTNRSAQLLDVSTAGLLLADPRGELRVVAASSEAADQSAAARATANQPRGAFTLALAGFHRRGGLNIVFLILDGDARQSE